MKLAILSGTSLTTVSLFKNWPLKTIKTSYGEVQYWEKGNVVLVNRHGADGRTPPHSIPHRANIQALVALGVDEVLTFSSVGSLREDWAPGTLVSCSDYVSFMPATFSDEVMKAVVPKVENRLLRQIQAQLDIPIREGGVYVQTRGPRFETVAEIRVIKQFGDVVGMTFAHEADLCAEVGLPLTSLCSIDNYANGILEVEKGPEFFSELVQKNRSLVERVFQAVLTVFV